MNSISRKIMVALVTVLSFSTVGAFADTVDVAGGTNAGVGYAGIGYAGQKGGYLAGQKGYLAGQKGGVLAGQKGYLAGQKGGIRAGQKY